MYDRQSTYLTWGGTIGDSGLDTWQCGVHLALGSGAGGDGPGLPDVSELTTLLNGAIATWHGNAQVATSSYCFLSWARAASLDPDGHYTAEPVVAQRTKLGGGAASVLQSAPQVALCVTLSSGLTLGHANHGRFYSPWNEAQLDGDGKIPTANLPAILTAAQALVNGINTWSHSALSAGCAIYVLSKIAGGTSRRVAQVRIGSVKDTQQRRRRQLDETYVTASISA